MSQSSKSSRKRKLPSPEASSKRFCCAATDPRSTDPDILLFQTPYMKVRLKEYRRQVQSLESQLEESEKQKKFYNNFVQVIKHHWTSLVDGLQVLLMRVDVSASFPTPSKQPNSVSSSLLQSLINHHTFSVSKVEFLNDSEFVDKQLEEKTKTSQNILLKIVQSIEAQRNSSEEISAMLRFDKDAAGIEASLKEENERLNSALKRSDQTLDAVQLKLKEIQEEKEKLSDDYLLLKEQAQKWKKERDDAIAKHQNSLREIDNLTLLPPPSLPLKRTKVESGPSPSSASSSSSAPAKGSNSASEKSDADADAFAESIEIQQLKIELEETKRLAESRLNEINRLGDKHHHMVKSSEALKHSLEDLSTDMILSNPKYIEVKQSSEFYQKGYYEYFGHFERIRNENQSLRREIDDQRISFEEKINSKVEEFLKIQKEKDSVIVQLKKERDALAYRYEEKMEQPAPEDLLKELRALTSSQASHLKRLRSQVDRRAISGGTDGEEGGGRVQALEAQLKELESQVSFLTKEEKKWNEKKKEMQVLIDTYKLASKDRRDIVEVRTSERKLQEDCDELTKKVKALEQDLEKHASTQARSSSSSSAESVPSKDSLESELKRLEKMNRELSRSKEAQDEGEKLLLAEMDEISKSVEELQEQNERLLQQVEEKYETSSMLVKEKLRTRKLQQKMTEENGILQEKCMRLAEKVDAQSNLLRSTEIRLRSLQDMNNRLQEDVRQCQSSLEVFKKTSREDAFKLQEMQDRHQTVQTSVEDLKNESLDRKLRLEEKELLCRQLGEERDTLQRKLDRTSKLATSKSSVKDEVVEEEMKELRRQLQCDVCKDRRKSCIVSKCWHMFCRECIDHSLQARRRICPACARSIARTEVHDIFL
jgi:E3 ubiquitin-protein ligase BRE1